MKRIFCNAVASRTIFMALLGSVCMPGATYANTLQFDSTTSAAFSASSGSGTKNYYDTNTGSLVYQGSTTDYNNLTFLMAGTANSQPPPSAMSIGASTSFTALTFADGFNGSGSTANTTTITNNSANNYNLHINTGGSINDNASSGTITFGSTSTGTLSIQLYGTDTINVATGASLVFSSGNSAANPAIPSTMFVDESGTKTGGILKTGGGILTLPSGNTFTGKTSITGGFIAASGESTFGKNPGALVADQITLNGGGIQAVGNINFSSNRGITLGANGGTFDTNTFNITASNTNPIIGSGALSKINAGTLTLAAANTFTGNTAITGGSLLVTNTTGSGTGTGNVTVDSSTALFGGTGTVTGSVTVGSATTGGTISAGTATQTAKTTLTTGALTLATGSTFNAIIAGDSAYGTLSASGTTALGNSAFTITVPSGTTLIAGETLELITSPVTGQFTNTVFSAGGYNFTADYTTNLGFFDIDITAVPEPTTIFAALLMVGGLGWNQRRQLRGLAGLLKKQMAV